MTMIKFYEKTTLAIAAVLAAAIILAGPQARAGEILARVTVESDEVYVGEPFMMRITVIGSADAERPDLSGLEGFEVKFQGGTNNSSHSVSIINGKVTRNVTKEYIYNYTLTALKTGTLTIPPIEVEAEGRTLRSNSVTIRAKRPEETEDFKLRARLSKKSAYVGEPVLLNVTWYLNRDIRSFEFTAPFLDTDNFTVEEPEVEIDSRKQYFRVPIAGYEFIAEKGRDTLAAKQYATLSFSMAVTPKEQGVFTIPEFIVACETGSAVRDRFFDDFFSDRFRGRERSRKYVIPSNTPSISVKPLPLAGRPDDFAGHIGEYSISASAEPLEVNIGDPITLEVTLEGPEYLDNVTLPPLSGMEGFTGNFKIPEERAAGTVEDGRKVFTQTIRPVREGVTEIPPVRLVSFDTETEEYRTVSTEPIPLKVNPTRVVKASDAEGISVPGQMTALESWKDGIAYNYEGTEVLAKRDYGFYAALSRWWNLALITVPPALFLLILTGTVLVRRRSSDPEGRRARRALKEARKKLSAIRKPDREGQAFCGEILEVLKEYMACRLCRQSVSMTAAEIEEELEKRDIERETVDSLREIIETCEAGTYAGEKPTGMDDAPSVTRRMEELLKRIDRKL
jgi:hypothetical protein